MDSNEFEKLIASGQFIEGIYNYCDRWCERCPMTAKCMLFATENARDAVPGDDDINNAAFWNRLAESLHDSLNMLKQACLERGIKLDELQGPAITSQELDAAQERLETLPLPRLAHEYAERVNQWFESASPDFTAKGDELRSIDQMDLDDHDPEADALDIQDCVEVIRWYQYQIPIKVMRAYSGATAILGAQGQLADELQQLQTQFKTHPGLSSDLDDFLAEDDVDDLLAFRHSNDETRVEEAHLEDDPFADLDDLDDPEFEAAMRAAQETDANGSAKVALLSIDRSIAAWTRLRPHLPDRADDILDLLVMLTRLRRDIESQFPQARDFKRPGFDQ